MQHNENRFVCTRGNAGKFSDLPGASWLSMASAVQAKTARQMTRRDYETYHYLIAMDRNNLRNMVRFVGSDPEHKVSLLMDHTSRPGDV